GGEGSEFARGGLRGRREPVPRHQDLPQRRPRLLPAPRSGRRRPQASPRHLLHRREAGGRRPPGHPVGPLLRLQPQQVRLQGPLQTPPGPRDRRPGRRAHRLPQGRLGRRHSGGHDAPRRPRRRPRSRLRRRRLRGGRRVPAEREGPPRRGDKRRPVHLPGPAGRLRSSHRPRGHTEFVSEGFRRQASAVGL
ncbi:MAG: hypothetical protein AVDCRST_MAG12-1540, partial [uncultured Rubrobacteraceae bacterium]